MKIFRQCLMGRMVSKLAAIIGHMTFTGKLTSTCIHSTLYSSVTTFTAKGDFSYCNIHLSFYNKIMFKKTRSLTNAICNTQKIFLSEYNYMDDFDL